MNNYILRHPLFRVQEFRAAHAGHGRRSPRSTAALLRLRLKSGALVHIRRGLYAVAPAGNLPPGAAGARRATDTGTWAPDAILIASRLSPTAVIAYEAALHVLGWTASPPTRLHYLSPRRARPFTWQGTTCLAVPAPPALRRLPDLGGGIEDVTWHGLPIQVTTLERTVVDLLDAPRYGGGIDRVWQLLAPLSALDFDFIVLYAIRLGSALTAGRVGFFLDHHRDRLGVGDRYLDALARHSPRQPIYIDRRREPGRLLPRWNLVVPERLLQV